MTMNSASTIATTCRQHMRALSPQPSGARTRLRGRRGQGEAVARKGGELLEEMNSSCDALRMCRRSWHASCGLTAPMGSGGESGAGRGEMWAAHLEIGRRRW